MDILLLFFFRYFFRLSNGHKGEVFMLEDLRGCFLFFTLIVWKPLL